MMGRIIRLLGLFFGFSIIASLAIAKDNYVTFGIMQLSTAETIPFADRYNRYEQVHSNVISKENDFKDENPDIQQFYFHRELYLTGTKNSPLYFNYGWIGHWIETERYHQSGYGLYGEVKYGRGVSITLGWENGTTNGTVTGSGFIFNDNNCLSPCSYSIIADEERSVNFKGQYSAPMYFRLNLEQEFDTKLVSLFYISKKIEFSTEEEFPIDALPYQGLGLSIGFKH